MWDQCGQNHRPRRRHRSGGRGMLAIIVALTKESCPFVYSWDGKRYVFDAEPYGGAIARVLERDDYPELEHLKPHHGEYRLLITNEVDRDPAHQSAGVVGGGPRPGTRVVSDNQGHLYGFRKRRAPPICTRPRRERHHRVAGGHGPAHLGAEAKLAADGSPREEIILSFPQARGGRHGKPRGQRGRQSCGVRT